MTEPEYPKQSRSKQDTGTWSEGTWTHLQHERSKYSKAEKAALARGWAEDAEVPGDRPATTMPVPASPLVLGAILTASEGVDDPPTV